MTRNRSGRHDRLTRPAGHILGAALAMLLAGPVLAGAAPRPGTAPAGHATLGDSVLPPAVAPAARRSWMARQSALCLGAIAEAGARNRVPPGLLEAVARVETGRPLPVTGDRQPWPWSVNSDGESLFFDTRASAAAEAARRLAHGARYVDIGCTQVDLRMHPDAFPTLADAFNPATNADYAARLLAALHAASHSWELAAGRYHSATPGLLEPYQASVSRMRRTQKNRLAN
jgi:soluble lytic murein transglycosylase-like protein